MKAWKRSVMVARHIGHCRSCAAHVMHAETWPQGRVKQVLGLSMQIAQSRSSALEATGVVAAGAAPRGLGKLGSTAGAGGGPGGGGGIAPREVGGAGTSTVVAPGGTAAPCGTMSPLMAASYGYPGAGTGVAARHLWSIQL